MDFGKYLSKYEMRFHFILPYIEINIILWFKSDFSLLALFIYNSIKSAKDTTLSKLRIKLQKYKEKEKEEDDNNYNKILETIGEVLGQDEIAENYYNNVDTGKYSNVDISNEQRETINEIEDKLY